MLSPTDSPAQTPEAQTPAGRLFRRLALHLAPEAQTSAGRVVRCLTSPQARCLALALLMTVALTALGVTILDQYHLRAHYHFDSASYRYSAMLLSQSSKGARWTAAGQLLQQKDSLDLVLRLLLHPKSLASFHGHLYVQAPFMAAFFFLALWYVYQRTGTFLYGVAALSSVFLFGTVYHPIQGLMDYWKENLAVWLLGGALLSWFLSERGTRRGWFFLCGVFLSLLAYQRVVVAVYGTVIFLPILAIALVQRFRDGSGWRKLLGDAFAFGALPLVAAGFLVATQAKGVIHYYAVTGYAYAAPSAIAEFLWTHPFSTPRAFRLGLLAFLVLPSLALLAGGPGRFRHLLAGLWPVVAFPATVIATKAQYHSYSTVLLVLAVVAVCRLVPGHLSAQSVRRLASVLLCVALVGGVVQARYYAAMTEQYAQRNAQYRQVYRELGEVLVAKPAGAGVGFFFDECFALAQLQLYYDRGVRPDGRELKYFSSVHPSYYRASFGDKSPEEIATYILSHMEQDAGMVAVVPVRMEYFAARITVEPGTVGEPVPLQVNGRITRHIQASPRWKAIRYVTSEVYGPLLVFQLSEKPLSLEEKWGSLNYTAPVSGLNVAAAVAPGVRQLSYWSPLTCPPDWSNGVAHQWVPAGEHGVSITLLADRPTEVTLRAGVSPGPSKSGPNRTVVVRHAGADQRFEFTGDGDLVAPLRLQPGLNTVEILSADKADVPPPGAETRPLVLRLRSPYLLPAGSPEGAKP